MSQGTYQAATITKAKSIPTGILFSDGVQIGEVLRTIQPGERITEENLRISGSKPGSVLPAKVWKVLHDVAK